MYTESNTDNWTELNVAIFIFLLYINTSLSEIQNIQNVKQDYELLNQVVCFSIMMVIKVSV